MRTATASAKNSVEKYCRLSGSVLYRMIEHAKAGGSAEMSMVPKDDGSGAYESLPDLIAHDAEDVYGNLNDVRLNVTYNASTGIFSAGTRDQPGIEFLADGTVIAAE